MIHGRRRLSCGSRGSTRAAAHRAAWSRHALRADQARHLVLLRGRRARRSMADAPQPRPSEPRRGLLPVVALTVRGARTGVQRTVPLVDLTDCDDVILIALSLSRPRYPAWCHNIKANPRGHVGGKGAQSSLSRARGRWRGSRAAVRACQAALRGVWELRGAYGWDPACSCAAAGASLSVGGARRNAQVACGLARGVARTAATPGIQRRTHPMRCCSADGA